MFLKSTNYPADEAISVMKFVSREFERCEARAHRLRVACTFVTLDVQGRTRVLLAQCGELGQLLPRGRRRVTQKMNRSAALQDVGAEWLGYDPSGR
jgi:hypothetical protein